jgi:endonuclease/exonuclease/phosphatase family metal-dependent hydrolase
MDAAEKSRPPRVAPLRVATWNIHRARGSDGRVDPDRILRVLAAEVAPPGTLDALVLQEADGEAPPHAGLLDLPRLEAELGLRHAHPGAVWGAESHGFLGTIVLLGPGLSPAGVALLDLPGRCHRGAVAIEVCGPGRAFRLIATHLSLGQPLRAAQMRVVGQYLARVPDRPTLLVGDLNEWRPWGGLALAPRLVGRRFAGPARATFPARRPLLPLDRVLATPPARVRAARVLDGPGIRAGSDHRPLRAEVQLPPSC